VTYDEHGGFYDHEPPIARVPNPGTTQDLGTRLLHFFLRRRSARFDFTILGLRVPAVVISPYVPRGYVDDTLHDHSSVPKTLRLITAPTADCLTARDDWAQPFHTLLSLAAPRRDDLPELSGFLASEPPQLPPSPATPMQVAGRPRLTSRARTFPPYYQAFLAQAEQVHRHLVRLREDEAKTPLRGSTPSERASEIAQIFTMAAQRHRDEQRVSAGVVSTSGDLHT